MNMSRRCRIELLSPAELSIINAITEVEKMAADILLTDAVILLGQARDKVADFIDQEMKSSDPFGKQP